MKKTTGYIYIRNHPSYDCDDVCKMGKANNIPERDTQYATGEVKRGYFEDVYEVPNEKTAIIERLLQNEFCVLNIRYDAGTEFYNKKIITLVEPYLISIGIRYKKLSKEEINVLTRCNRVRNTFKKINIHFLIKILNLRRKYKKYIWNEREYQRNIINFSKNELLLRNKLYIELPTGGGKSYIVYNLFDYLKSDFIVIVSPRKIVNSQNISDKYLQILRENYTTFDYSNEINFEGYLSLKSKKIVICCTQSINKIYKILVSNNITNITIWFDEAHWGIEEWIDKLTNDENKKFWLLNNTFVKYRIFTSASPNKAKILQNEHIFGKLFSPIKVNELINLNWLSNIVPYVYSENEENVDKIKYIISDFNEKDRKYGFSFHNKQKNAFNLFNNHYKEYKNGETRIKPFLLVSDNFKNEKEPRLKEIILDYDYKNVKIYEESIYSIAYVVAKYSMGYDFNKLDFMCLSDPKLSIQDIIQCIGRGIRSDELGENGLNKEKILVVSLPVYIDAKGDNKYEKVIEVLKYLLYDIGITFEEIEFKNRYKSNVNFVDVNSNEYFGVNNIKSTLLNLLENENKRISFSTTYEKAIKIIADEKIKNKNVYYQLCDRDNRLSKEPEIVFKGQFTNWIEYLSIERKYYDLETCKNKISQHLSSNPELKKHYLDLSIVSSELCKIDNLFPPNELWCEYYNVNDLRDIIIIRTIKKKAVLIF